MSRIYTISPDPFLVVIKDEEHDTLTVFAVNKDLENPYEVTMEIGGK